MLTDEMYPNPLRVMVCKNCKAERHVPTAGLTKAEVIEQMKTFHCIDCMIKLRLCHCGAGLPRRELRDARGIFCTFVCDSCERQKRKKFRADIFTDPNYWTEEPIDPE